MIVVLPACGVRVYAALLLGGLLIASQALAPSGADAQRRRGRAAASADGEPTAPTPTVADLAEIVPRLQSTSPDQVREAIDLLSVIDDPRVVPPLADLLRSGQPDAVVDRALEALRGLAAPTSIDVLTEFTRHRRAGARRRAYLALAAVRDRRVPALVEQGLRDSDRAVRGACALALGTMGASSSLDLLFRAFDRGVLEAAVSIGKLGNDASVERFTEHLGQVPLSVMLSGYEQFLRRTEISEQVKVDIVSRLGDVSGAAVRGFLAQYLDTFNARDRGRLRTVVQDTLRRIPIEGDTRRTAPAAGAAAGGEE